MKLKGKGRVEALKNNCEISLAKKENKAFFVYGFAKNKQANISQDELVTYKELAKVLLDLNDAKLTLALSSKAITEIT